MVTSIFGILMGGLMYGASTTKMYDILSRFVPLNNVLLEDTTILPNSPQYTKESIQEIYKSYYRARSFQVGGLVLLGLGSLGLGIGVCAAAELIKN